MPALTSLRETCSLCRQTLCTMSTWTTWYPSSLLGKRNVFILMFRSHFTCEYSVIVRCQTILCTVNDRVYCKDCSYWYFCRREYYRDVWNLLSSQGLFYVEWLTPGMSCHFMVPTNSMVLLIVWVSSWVALLCTALPSSHACCSIASWQFSSHNVLAKLVLALPVEV